MLSLIIPSFNRGAFIETCLESVLAQTVDGWEAVIADDGSTDDTLTRLQPFLSHPRIRLVRKEVNQGISFTLNRGVAASRGDFFARLDPDDALHPAAVEWLLWAFQQFPENGLIYSTCFICNPSLSPLWVPRWIGAISTSNMEEDRIAHLAAFDRRAFDRTEGFDPRFKKAVDKDIYFKMEEVAPTLFLPLPLYYYRVHSGGVSQGEDQPLATLYHAEAFLAAYHRRKARGLPNVTRIKAARILYGLGRSGLAGDRFWASRIFLSAIRLDPLRRRYWKTLVGRGLLDIRRH